MAWRAIFCAWNGFQEGHGTIMNFEEAEHITMLRETLRRFVEAEMPRAKAADWDERDHFPREVFDKLAKLGVMGLTVPEEFGGGGRDILACMVTIEELAKRSSAISVPYIMAACYAGMNLVDSASDRQKRELLPKVAAGRMIFAYGLTEPDIGSDLANVRTTARRRGSRIVVNGAKRFCTGAQFADYIYTLVRSDDEGGKYKNLSLVLVPPTAPGVSISTIGTLGLKGAPATDVVFDDVEIDAGNVIGEADGWNRGWDMLVGPVLDVEKLEVAALAVGIAQAALDDAMAYAQQRSQFGKPIGSFQAIRNMLAEGQAKVHASRLMTYQAAWLANERKSCRAETSMAKMLVCELCKEVVLSCQQVMGAYGYAKGFDMERYVRDILVMPIIGGSTNIQKNNVANAFRLPR